MIAGTILLGDLLKCDLPSVTPTGQGAPMTVTGAPVAFHTMGPRKRQLESAACRHLVCVCCGSAVPDSLRPGL